MSIPQICCRNKVCHTISGNEMNLMLIQRSREGNIFFTTALTGMLNGLKGVLAFIISCEDALQIDVDM